MKKTVKILILGLIILQSGCKKEPKPNPIYHKLRMNEAKDYIWAKPGSYWIYKNTKTNELDTWSCNGFYYDSFIVKGTEDYARHITLDFDYLRTSKHSTYYNWIYDDKTTTFIPETFKTYFFGIDRTCKSGLISPYHYPYYFDLFSGSGSSITSYLGMDTILNIQNKIYNNIVKFKIIPDDIWYPDDYLGPIKYPNAIYYWAKDVGLVKRENLTENFSWELIEYNIIK